MDITGTITNGGPCEPTECPNDLSRVTPAITKSSWLTLEPSRPTLRNPLYHWTHLELRRYFGITELLNEESAPRIWAQANEQLQELTVHRILEKFRVSVICTTDDPTDDLAAHQAIRTSSLPTRVYPALRPDKVFTIDQGDAFQTWVERLEKVSGRSGSELAGLARSPASSARLFWITRGETIGSRHTFYLFGAVR